MSDEQPRRRGFITGNYYSVLDRRTRKIAFLAGLVDGQTVNDAAAFVRVPYRTIYSWRREDPAFRKAWNEARARAALAERSYPLPPPPKPQTPEPEITIRSFGPVKDDTDD